MSDYYEERKRIKDKHEREKIDNKKTGKLEEHCEGAVADPLGRERYTMCPIILQYGPDYCLMSLSDKIKTKDDCEVYGHLKELKTVNEK